MFTDYVQIARSVRENDIYLIGYSYSATHHSQRLSELGGYAWQIDVRVRGAAQVGHLVHCLHPLLQN